MTGLAADLTKPSDDKRFEDLSCVLFGAILNDRVLSEGRRGQKQAGVDTWGYRNGDEGHIVGIQCKVRTQNILTAKDVIDEVEAARLFRPGLKEYYILTTADGDTKLDELARKINQGDDFEKPPFKVIILGWREITKLVVEHELETIFDPTFSPLLVSIRSHIAEQNVLLNSIKGGLEIPRVAARRCNHDKPIPLKPNAPFHHGIHGPPTTFQIPFFLPGETPYLYFHAHPVAKTEQKSLSSMALALGGNFTLMTPSGLADTPVRLSDFMLCAATQMTNSGRKIEDGTLFFRDGEVCSFVDCTHGVDLPKTLHSFFAAVQFAAEVWRVGFDIATGLQSPEGRLISFKLNWDTSIQICTGIFPIYSRTFLFSNNTLNLETVTDLFEGAGIHIEKGALYKKIRNAVHGLEKTEKTFEDIEF